MLGFGAQLRGLTVARVVTRKEFGKLKKRRYCFLLPRGQTVWSAQAARQWRLSAVASSA